MDTFGFNSENELFAGTENGIYRSIDNGVTWINFKEGLIVPEIFSLAFLPNGTIIAGSRIGLYRSTDNGETWNFLTTGVIDLYQINGLAVNQNGNLYAGIHAGGSQSNKLFRTTENLESWIALNCINSLYCIAINSSGYIFIGTGDEGILRSIDGVNNWTEINNGIKPSQSGGRVSYAGIYGIAVNRDNYIFVIYRRRLYRSTNNGNTWEEIEIDF